LPLRRLVDTVTIRSIAVSATAIVLSAWLAGCEPAPEQQSAATAPVTETAPAQADARAGTLPAGTGFDFYVLSLSWSPSYCEAEGEDANQQQCEAGRLYAFVVHGLWPQFERGYPEDCPSQEPNVSRETLRSLYDIMPSAGLIRYQWKKHGSCTNLAQEDYFRVLRAARDKIVVPAEFRRLDTYKTVEPAEVERAFLESNQSLPADGFAVTCDKRYLREVRICLTKDLAFRPCPEVDRRACRLPKAVMPPMRGG
jgi:ribonuclease T2